jgi:hypothetical protein
MRHLCQCLGRATHRTQEVYYPLIIPSPPATHVHHHRSNKPPRTPTQVIPRTHDPDFFHSFSTFQQIFPTGPVHYKFSKL